MAANFNGDYGYIGYNRPPVTYWLPTNALEVEIQSSELDYYIGPPDKSEACLRDLTLMYNLNDENSCFEGSSLSYFYVWVRHKACVANTGYGTYTYGSTPDIASLLTDNITVTPERVSCGNTFVFSDGLIGTLDTSGGYKGTDITGNITSQLAALDAINNVVQKDTSALIANYQWGYYEDWAKSNHYMDAYVTGIWTRYKITVNWKAIGKYTRLISIVLPVYMLTANSNIAWIDPEEGKGDITTKYEVVQWRINIKMAQTVVDNPIVPTNNNYWCYDFPVRRFTKEEREYLLKVRYPLNIYTADNGTKNITLENYCTAYPFGVSTEVNGNLLLHNAWAGSWNGITSYKPDNDTQKAFQKSLIQALMSTYPVLDRLNMEISSSIWYTDVYRLNLTSNMGSFLWPDTILYDAPILALTAFTKKSTVAYGSSSNTFSTSAASTLFLYSVYKIENGESKLLTLGHSGASIWKYKESGDRDYGSENQYVNVINEFPFSYINPVLGTTYSFTYLTGSNSNPTCLIAPSPTLLGKVYPSTKEPITYLITIEPNISETTSKELASYYGVNTNKPTLFQWTVKVYNKSFYPNVTDPNTINNVSEEYIDTEDLKYTTSEQESLNMNLRCVDTNEGVSYSSTSLLFKQNSSNYYSTMKSKDLVLFAGNYSTENNTNALFTEMNSILSSVKEGSKVQIYTPYTGESLSFKRREDSNVYSVTCSLLDLAKDIREKESISTDIYLFGLAIESPKASEDTDVLIFENGDFSAPTTYSRYSNVKGLSTLTLSSMGKSTLYFSDTGSNNNFTQKIHSVDFPFVDLYGVFNEGLKLDLSSSAYIQFNYPKAVTLKNYRYGNYNEDTPASLDEAKSRYPLCLPPGTAWNLVYIPTGTVEGLSDAKSPLNLWGMYLRYVKLNMDDTSNPYLDITIRVMAALLTDTTWLSQVHPDTVLHTAVKLTVSHVTSPEDPLNWEDQHDYMTTYSTTNRVYGWDHSVYKYLDDLYVYSGNSHTNSYYKLLTDTDGNAKSYVYLTYKLYLKDLLKSGTTYEWVVDNSNLATAEDFIKNFGLNFVWKLDYIVYADTDSSQNNFDPRNGVIVSSVSNIFSTQCNVQNQLYCVDAISDEDGDFYTSLLDCIDTAPHTCTLVRTQLVDSNAVKPENFGITLLDALFMYSEDGETKYHILLKEKGNENGHSAYYLNVNQFSSSDLETYSDPNNENYNEIFGNVLGIPEYEDARLEVTWIKNVEAKETDTTKLLRVTIPATVKDDSHYISKCYNTDYALDTFDVKASFLYWYNGREGVEYTTEVPELLKSEEKYKVFNVAKVSTDVDYDYTPYMNNSSREKRVFKANEEYKLGIVFKYLDGTLSPVYDGSYVNKAGEEAGLKDIWVPEIEPTILSIPEVENYATTNPVYDLDIEALKRFITAKKSVRVILLHPQISKTLDKYNIASIIPVRLHRTNTKIKALGIINPGITTKDLNNTIGVDAQYDWFYRETLVNHAVWLPSYKSDPNTTSVVPTTNATNNATEDKTERIWSGGANSKLAPDWINNFEIEIQSLDDSSRESEKTGLVSSGTLLTFNSPELEMDETFSQYMLLGTRLRHLKTYNDVTYGNNVELQYNGANRLSSLETSDIYQNTGTLSAENCLDMVYPKQYLDAENLGSIEALTNMYASKDANHPKAHLAALKVSLKGMKHHKFKSGFLWYGYGPFGVTSTEEAIKNATLITDVTENYAFFKVYPWMRNRLGGEVGDDYTIKTKRYFSQTYATGASYYTPAVEDIYISGVTISNSQTNIIHKLYNTNTSKSCLYLGTTDAIVVASALNSQGAYRIRCRGDWYASDNTRKGNDSWCYTTASEDAGSTAPSIGGILRDLCRDPIQMRYKAAPHAVFFFNGGSMSTSKKGINVGELYNINELPELRTENYIQGTWLPCGKQVPLSLDRNWTTIVFEEGDFFFGRFDSLRTQPYADDDVNQVTEVVSTMLCSRINLDARYDSNRGVKTPTISNTNFNLRNPVYDQLNNYFTYSYLDVKDLNSTREYKSTILWSLLKTMGETIDSWCDIQDSNFLDFNGTLGSIISINSLGNNIIVFLENGIAVLQYNEKTLVATNTGVPVEIANSNKVEGKYYISQAVGCQSAKAIAETPSGIYFIDSTRKTLYYLAPNLELKDISLLGLKAWSKRNLDSKWYTVYDSIAEEVLFINSDEALVYDIAHLCFSSFLTYGNIKHWFRMGPYTCQVKPLSYELVADIELVLGKDIGIYNNNNYLGFTRKTTPTTTIWLRNTQEASSLFGATVPLTIEWVCNPSPLNDKIFTNIQYRADAFCEDDTYISDDTFDTIRLIDEYLDTYKNLLYWRKHTVSNLKKKFRMWNITIPRALELTDINDLYSYTRDRIRNMWCKIQLKHDSINITDGNTSKGYWKLIPFKDNNTPVILDITDLLDKEYGKTLPDRNSSSYSDGDIFNLIDDNNQIIHKYMFHKSARFVFYDALVSYLPC